MRGLIAAPPDAAQIPAWREQLHRWRDSTRVLLEYDDSLYTDPAFAWIPHTFTLGFVMLCDRTFYDEGGYQLEAFLEYGEREFGGYDALILWHAYPRIGFDSRNQFDFYRDMPGGLDSLRALVDQCHARGVRVYLDYNPWDTGTRREGMSDIDALVALVAALDADAIFLDTMAHAADGLRARLDAIRPGVSLESEVLVPVEHLETHPSSWAQSLEDVPGVLRNKWFERRHMQHRVRRWQTDHTPELHTAWMNGSGMIVWENVFGTWRVWSARDKSILRSMIGVQRRYADLFCGAGWTPLVPTLHEGVRASLWEGENSPTRLRLWTLVNETESDCNGALIAVEHHVGDHYFDLIAGRAVTPRIVDGEALLDGHIRPRGIGAWLACAEESPDLESFLDRQAKLDARAHWDAIPPACIERLHPIPVIQRMDNATPPGMVTIPSAHFTLTTTFRVRECGFYHVPGVTPPNLRFQNLHRPWSMQQEVDLPAYALDLTPVTNAQFAHFLTATGYVPEHPENFLRHWDNRFIPPALTDHPVVYVGLEDARAYAAWQGKRLPTEAEWQYAAQGEIGYRYPWGDDWQPTFCNHGQMGGTTPVTHYPQGSSPYGCYDLCGNVWEWTESERDDGRTRFVLLKGGGWYRAHGSDWYADGGAQTNDFAAKFLLMYPGLDRCATIGFRCAL